MKKQIKSLLLVIVFIGMALSAWAQASTEGTEFWVGLTMSIRPPDDGDGEAKPYLAISSKETTNITITNPAFPNAAITHAIPADRWFKVEDIPLNWWYPSGVGNPSKVKQHADEVNRYGIFVKADHNISVYAILRAGAGMDASNILPVSAIQTEYILQDYVPQAKSGDKPYITMATILATEDNTQIKVKPSCPILTSTPQQLVNNQITLNKGQTYYLMAENDGQNNNSLSGTEITADRKIAVFQGVPCTYVPQAVGNRDCLFEQAWPIDYWGTEFIATRSYAKGANIIRITASMGDLALPTTLTINGQKIQGGLVRGQTYEIELDASNNMNNTSKVTRQPDMQLIGDYVHIKSSCPVAVYSYDVGKGYSDKNKTETNPDGKQEGDPSSVWIAPLEQSINHITFGLCGTNSDGGNKTEHHYMDIVVPTADVAKTTISPAPKDPNYDVNSSFIAVPKTDYSYARIYLAQANGDSKAAFTVSNPGGLIAHVYGNGESESYAYSVGSAAVLLGVKVDGNTFVNGHVSNQKFCLGHVFEFDAKVGSNDITRVDWNFGDGTVATGPTKVTHEYYSPGWYDVTAHLFGTQPCTDEAEQPLGDVSFSFQVVEQKTVYGSVKHICLDDPTDPNIGKNITKEVIPDNCWEDIVINVVNYGLNTSGKDTVIAKDSYTEPLNGLTYPLNPDDPTNYEVDLEFDLGMINQYACDSILKRHVTIIACLDMDVYNYPDEQFVCQGEDLEIPYIHRKGKMGTITAKDLEVTIDTENKLFVLQTKDLKPGVYETVISIEDKDCETVLNFPIGFRVFYPASIFKYKFNNVLAVYTKEHNGGYDFKAYQWYKDGSKIDGANESIYHTEGQMPPGEYFVMLTDMNDMTLPSCSQTVVARDITSHPTEEAPAKKVMYNNHICISIGDTLYDIYGQKVK